MVNSSKTDKCYVYFDKLTFSIADRILYFNGGSSTITAKSAPTFSSLSTTNEGMYAAPDNYGTSYYFRGAVNNNWLYFAGFYWRIIRINGDNSVRIIFSGTTAPTSSTDTVMTGAGTQIGTNMYNDGGGDNQFVGYKYTSGTVHGTSVNSTMKTYIENWYTNNLSSYSSLLSDSIYCNDRIPYNDANGQATGYGTTDFATFYAPYIRTYTNHLPILNCLTKEDSFTVSDTTNGNGSLINPIGLITADEVEMAGGINQNNTNYYLYTNSEYYTMSPSHSSWYAGSLGIFVSVIDANGNLIFNRVGQSLGVRPVISLKSTVLASGSGTYNDPYVVQ